MCSRHVPGSAPCSLLLCSVLSSAFFDQPLLSLRCIFSSLKRVLPFSPLPVLTPPPPRRWEISAGGSGPRWWEQRQNSRRWVTGGENREREREGAVEEEASSSQAHLGDEVWGLAVSEATPPLCSSKWVLSRPPPSTPPFSAGTGATAHTMPCCQGREEEDSVQLSVGPASLSTAGGRQPGGKNRKLCGNRRYVCLSMPECMPVWVMHVLNWVVRFVFCTQSLAGQLLERQTVGYHVTPSVA